MLGNEAAIFESLAYGPETTKTFSVFKYAEEHAYQLVHNGHAFRMLMIPNVDHEEDGETYTYHEYLVEDLGEF